MSEFDPKDTPRPRFPAYEQQVSALADMHEWISYELFETGASLEVIVSGCERKPYYRRAETGIRFLDNQYVPGVTITLPHPQLRLVALQHDETGARTGYEHWPVATIVDGGELEPAPGVPQRAVDIVYDAAMYLSEQRRGGILPHLQHDLLTIARTGYDLHGPGDDLF